jgi:RNA polymerase sigma factor (sigma-70 family)
MFDEALL